MSQRGCNGIFVVVDSFDITGDAKQPVDAIISASRVANIIVVRVILRSDAPSTFTWVCCCCCTAEKLKECIASPTQLFLNFSKDHMYQPERFQITIPETVPTYAFVGPYQSSVSYHYPYEIVVREDDRSDVFLSETSAIRRELSQIKNDVSEMKQRQTSPTYYTIKQDYPTVVCSICNASSSSSNQQTQHSQTPMYYCERCRSFVEKPAYSVTTKLRSKTPHTTYQDSYRPPPYAYPHGYLDRQITLNELQTESPPSSAPVQHPRHWIPAASRNAYPYRRWNLSVPHSEP